MKDMFGLLKRLQPPLPGASDEEMYSWRWMMSITSGFTAIALAAHIAMACGFLTVVHPGFAMASDIRSLKEDLRGYKETQIEAQILDAQTKKCHQTNPQVRALYTGSLQKLMIEYQKLTGRTYPLPTCTEFTAG